MSTVNNSDRYSSVKTVLSSGRSVLLLCKFCGEDFATNDELRSHILKQQSKEAILEHRGCSPNGPLHNLPVGTPTWNYMKKLSQYVNTKLSKGRANKLEEVPLGNDEQTPQQDLAERYRFPIQNDQDGCQPLSCEYCQKTFTSHHQLVLHSKTHILEKNPSEDSSSSPNAQLTTTTFSLEAGKEGEDKTLVPVCVPEAENAANPSQGRSTVCRYCGKSYQSRYIIIHLRTHTGEKPYKCGYCDYAAVQKVSLTRHLERNHKDPTLARKRSRHHSAFSIREDKDVGNGPTPKRSKLMGCPLPVDLEEKQLKMKTEVLDESLFLDLHMLASVAASAERLPVPVQCLFCAFKTTSPEELKIHNKMNHKGKSNYSRSRSTKGRVKRKLLPKLTSEHGLLPSIPEHGGPAFHQSTPFPGHALMEFGEPSNKKMRCSAPTGALPDVPAQGGVKRKLPPKPSPEHGALPNIPGPSNKKRRYFPPMGAPPDVPAQGSVKRKLPPKQSPEHWALPNIPAPSNKKKRYCPPMGAPPDIPAQGGVKRKLPPKQSPEHCALPNIPAPSNKKRRYSPPTARKAETLDRPGFRAPPVDGSSVKTPLLGSSPSSTAEVPQSLCPPVGSGSNGYQDGGDPGLQVTLSEQCWP